MGKEKRVLRVLALSLTGIFLLLLLWGLSPGPEWLARFAAERYARRYACDYSCHALVIEGEISRPGGWDVSGTVSILDCAVIPGGRPRPSGHRPSAGTQGRNFSHRSDGSQLVDTGRIHGAAGDSSAGFPIKKQENGAILCHIMLHLFPWAVPKTR